MRKQKGITLVGLILTVAVIIVLGVLAMRIAPVYIQHYTVTRSIKSLSTLRGDDVSVNPEFLKQKLMNQLYINGVNDIKEKNVSVTATDQENRYLVNIKYKVIRPLIGSMNLLFNFNESQEVNIGTN